MTLAVLITCHNRREQTLACLRALFAQTEAKAALPHLEVWLVDDGSRDGTAEAVATQFPSVHQIRGSGDLFWCGGMRLAWSHATNAKADAYLWLNDDVTLGTGAISTLSQVAAQNPEAVVVGSCSSPTTGLRTYGGLRRLGHHPGKTAAIEPGSAPLPCDTFQGNIVWIPATALASVGPMAGYRHAMGDVDYGYRLSEHGIPLLVAPGFLGSCATNSRQGTWEDPGLNRSERIRKLRGIKGLPAGDWWRFCRRNGGWRAPVYFVTPLLRILAGR